MDQSDFSSLNRMNSGISTSVSSTSSSQELPMKTKIIIYLVSSIILSIVVYVFVLYPADKAKKEEERDPIGKLIGISVGIGFGACLLLWIFGPGIVELVFK